MNRRLDDVRIFVGPFVKRVRGIDLHVYVEKKKGEDVTSDEWRLTRQTAATKLEVRSLIDEDPNE